MLLIFLVSNLMSLSNKAVKPIINVGKESECTEGNFYLSSVFAPSRKFCIGAQSGLLVKIPKGKKP